MRDAFPLIRRPDRQSPAQRWLFRALTTLAWVVWLYLWLPAVTLFAWLAGFQLAGRALLSDADRRYLETLAGYGVWVLLIVFAFLVWSGYNRHRFRGRPREGDVPVVDAEAVAADLPLSAEAVAAIMGSRKVTVEFDADGEPVGAVVKIRGEARTVEVH